MIGENESIERTRSSLVWPSQTTPYLEIDTGIVLHNISIDWIDHDDQNVEIEFYLRADRLESGLDPHCCFLD